MTLDELKLINFDREMTDQELTDICNNILQIQDKKKFASLILYLVDSIPYLDIQNYKDSNSFLIRNITKILKMDSIKNRIKNDYVSIEDFARSDE